MRLIDADAFCTECIRNSYLLSCDGCVIKDFKLRNTIEAEPVRRGNAKPYMVQYIGSGGNVVAEYQEGWQCSFCGEPGVKNYCPNCGAKMDGKENNNE